MWKQFYMESKSVKKVPFIHKQEGAQSMLFCGEQKFRTYC